MTDLLMVDGAYLRDPSPAVKALGNVVAWSLYVSGNFAVPDGYAKTVRADGYAPIPNYERGIWELVSDRATGQAAARIALADTIRVGFPNDGTIMCPFSVDVDVNPSDYHKVADAFTGIHDIIGEQYIISAYGQGDLLKYLAQNRLTGTKGWLSESASFPGFDVHSPYVCLAQNHDSAGNWRQPPAGMDISTITDITSLHAWWPDHSPYGANMPLTPADVKAVVAGVRDLLTGGGVLNDLNTQTAQFNAHLQPTIDRITRLSHGFDTTNPVPFAKQGELTLLLRAIAAQPAPPTTTEIADELVPRIPAAQATADISAIVQGVMDGVLAKLPPTATKEEIVATFRADLVANPFKLS